MRPLSTQNIDPVRSPRDMRIRLICGLTTLAKFITGLQT